LSKAVQETRGTLDIRSTSQQIQVESLVSKAELEAAGASLRQDLGLTNGLTSKIQQDVSGLELKLVGHEHSISSLATKSEKKHVAMSGVLEHVAVMGNSNQGLASKSELESLVQVQNKQASPLTQVVAALDKEMKAHRR
jgi:hypothetical protein